MNMGNLLLKKLLKICKKTKYMYNYKTYEKGGTLCTIEIPVGK